MCRFKSLVALVLLVSTQVTHVCAFDWSAIIFEQVRGADNPFFFPTYPGGEKALKKFLKKNMIYPEFLRQMEAEGQCVMHFTVGSDGSISDISATDCKVTSYNAEKWAKYSDQEQVTMKKECARQMAKEGLRLIRKMKRWNPAIRDEIPVSIKHSLTLSFSLEYLENE